MSTLTYGELMDVWLVKRDGVYLGTIERWDGELRYVHSPDRETVKSLSHDDLVKIARFMREISDGQDK